MIPKIIHQIWLGPQPIPSEHRRWMRGIRAMNPGWNYCLWRSTVGFDCHGIAANTASYASQANCLRLEVVQKLGGIYIDTDVQPVAPLDSLIELDAFVGVERVRPFLVCNAVFGARPGHPWIQAQIDRLPAFAKKRPPWGPTLMTETLSEGVTILPRRVFYPRLSNIANGLTKQEVLLCHHWHKSWGRREGQPRKGRADVALDGTPDGPPADLRKAAFKKAVSRGLMCKNQYSYLADRFGGGENESLLVFGIGHDSELWLRCATGEVVFVEHNDGFVALAPPDAVVVRCGYDSKVGKWTAVPAPPAAINRPWDYVLVDAPNGARPDSLGREWSISWAAKLARKAVFVHDYERPWERSVCDKMLGAPSEVIESLSAKRGYLAVFQL